MDRVRLTGISSRAWEVPGERGALAALRALEGYDDVRAALTDPTEDATLRGRSLAAGVRVDERQLSWVHRLFGAAADTLDVVGLPDLFVTPDPAPRAATVGVTRPFVVLSSGLLDQLDEEELGFVLAGQLGHAVSGHASHRTLLMRLDAVSWPLNPNALLVRSALAVWAHQAEIAADRAGLLATQDPTVALAALMQLASPGRVRDVDPGSFASQEIPEAVDPLDAAFDGPADRPVARAGALHRWLDTGALQRARAGDYPRRDDPSPPDDVSRQKAAYAEIFQGHRERLERLQTATGTGGVRRWLEGTFRRS